MELAAKADSKLRACVRKGEAKHGYWENHKKTIEKP